MYKSQQGSINRAYPDGVGKDLGPGLITGISPPLPPTIPSCWKHSAAGTS
jgi:hypothetical protein